MVAVGGGHFLRVDEQILDRRDDLRSMCFQILFRSFGDQRRGTTFARGHVVRRCLRKGEQSILLCLLEQVNRTMAQIVSFGKFALQLCGQFFPVGHLIGAENFQATSEDSIQFLRLLSRELLLLQLVAGEVLLQPGQLIRFQGVLLFGCQQVDLMVVQVCRSSDVRIQDIEIDLLIHLCYITMIKRITDDIDRWIDEIVGLLELGLQLVTHLLERENLRLRDEHQTLANQFVDFFDMFGKLPDGWLSGLNVITEDIGQFISMSVQLDTSTIVE